MRAQHGASQQASDLRHLANWAWWLIQGAADPPIPRPLPLSGVPASRRVRSPTAPPLCRASSRLITDRCWLNTTAATCCQRCCTHPQRETLARWQARAPAGCSLLRVTRPRPAPAPSRQLHRLLRQQLAHGLVPDDKEVALVELRHVPAGTSRWGARWVGRQRSLPHLNPSQQPPPPGTHACGRPRPAPHSELMARRPREQQSGAAHPSSSTVTCPRSSSTRQNTCLSRLGAGTRSLVLAAPAERTCGPGRAGSPLSTCPRPTPGSAPGSAQRPTLAGCLARKRARGAQRPPCMSALAPPPVIHAARTRWVLPPTHQRAEGLGQVVGRHGLEVAARQHKKLARIVVLLLREPRRQLCGEQGRGAALTACTPGSQAVLLAPLAKAEHGAWHARGAPSCT